MVVRDCSFHAAGTLVNGQLAEVVSDNLAGAELILQYCDGINSELFDNYVSVRGDRAFYAFVKCGSLWGSSRSFSTFPEDQTATPSRFRLVSGFVEVEPER